MAGVNMPWGFRADPTDDQAFAQYHVVTSGYFRLMGIEIVEGRPFGDADDEAAPPVVVVNDAFAESAFPGESAVGRRSPAGNDGDGFGAWRGPGGLVSGLAADPGMARTSRAPRSGRAVPRETEDGTVA